MAAGAASKSRKIQNDPKSVPGPSDHHRSTKLQLYSKYIGSRTYRATFRDVRFHGSFSYATSPYANMLSALAEPGNSRVFAGFSAKTLMVQGRNGQAFSLRIEGFSQKLEGWPIFPTRFIVLIYMNFIMQ